MSPIKLLLLFLSLQFAFTSNSYSGIKVQEDEFKEYKEDSSEDEFKEFNSDKFKELADSSGCNESAHQGCPNASECIGTEKATNYNSLYWVLWIIGFTFLAGVFVRFKKTRNLRGLFLILSVFILGFFDTPCTVCPINAIQNFILLMFGYDIIWYNILLFSSLIFITYIFGKVWCGWICHLGAIQELIYLPGKIKWLQSAKFQKWAKISRLILLFIFIIQLGIMGTKYWCRIDPFLTLFDIKWLSNFILNDSVFDYEIIIMISLLILILISSVFTFRPFCKTMCPVGLVLGFVAKIPSASVVGLNADCSSCIKCNNACNYKAITREEKTSILDNTECIYCGDCVDVCSKNGLKFFRKNKKHSDIVICKNDCKVNTIS